MKKVMVLKGGFSAEREVSLVSGAGVEQALRQKGYDVAGFDLKDSGALIDVLRREKPDVVFNALHGNWGEDGAVQAFLDMMQIPYTHSGMKASLLGMDKELSRQAAAENGVRVAEAERLRYGDYKSRGTKIPYPYVLKPVCDGSSVGVFIVRNDADRQAVSYERDDAELLCEKYIAGKELTVMVWKGRAYAVTELRPEVAFYDYKAKYTEGMTRHILPAEIPEEAAATARCYAETVHRALGCRMVSRSDFRYNAEDGVVFLEINTNPGLTPLSLVPEQARFAGISYEDLCAELVENAQCRSRK